LPRVAAGRGPALEAFSGDSLETFSIGLAGAEPECAPAMTSVPWRRPRGKGRWGKWGRRGRRGGWGRWGSGGAGGSGGVRWAGGLAGL